LQWEPLPHVAKRGGAPVAEWGRVRQVEGEFDGQVARRRMKTRQLCCPPPKCGANRCHCRKLNPASK